MGLPSPAADYVERRLPINEMLIHKPITTYYMLTGEIINQCDILKDTLLVIDSSLKPCDGSLLICDYENELKVKKVSHLSTASSLTFLEWPEVKVIG